NYTGSGHAFIMATGRNYEDIETISQNLNIPVEYAIAYNGALIYKNREEIFSNTLTTDQIFSVLSQSDLKSIKYNEVILFVENVDIYCKVKTFLGTLRRYVSALKNKRKIKVWKENTLNQLLKKKLRFPKICFIIYNREA